MGEGGGVALLIVSLFAVQFLRFSSRCRLARRHGRLPFCGSGFPGKPVQGGGGVGGGGGGRLG